MVGPQHLLRKASIERLASPEQLDTAMRVTSPAGWLALATLGVIILAVVVWSILGQLSVKVDGTGILLRGETVQTVQAAAAGTLKKLKVEEGNDVVAGQIVAELELPALEAEIAATRDRIADLDSQYERQSAQVESLRASYQSQLSALHEQRRNKQRLYRKGLARNQDVLAIKSQIASIDAQVIQAEMGLNDRGNVIEDERRKLGQLEDRFEGESIVRSPYAGRVAAVLAAEGELVTAGARLLNLEAADEPFQVLLFVPFAEGKKVRPLDDQGEPTKVRIAPTNVKTEEYGFIKGEILSVSRQPVTPEEVRRTLNNDQLAQKFAKDTPFKVIAKPKAADTPSLFEWTSAEGPPISISSSTPCTAQVIVEHRRPISYVIPLTKKALGMG